ncbi:MAG: hypothetical protein V1722_03990 [Candidatus Micrarchaeota archaeon]
MFEVWFDGLPVKVSHAAEKELVDLGLDAADAVEVLKNGFECSRSTRNRDKIERCFRKGDKIIRVVAAYGYSCFFKEEVLVLIHVSKEGLKYDKER